MVTKKYFKMAFLKYFSFLKYFLIKEQIQQNDCA